MAMADRTPLRANSPSPGGAGRSIRCRLGIHTVERSQGVVGYCLRGCGNLKRQYTDGHVWVRYVERPNRTTSNRDGEEVSQMKYRFEIQPATQFQKDNYDIQGTDVAMLVAVDGEFVGYTDDYGTATVVKPGAGDDTQEAIEELLAAASALYERLESGDEPH